MYTQYIIDRSMSIFIYSYVLIASAHSFGVLLINACLHAQTLTREAFHVTIHVLCVNHLLKLICTFSLFVPRLWNVRIILAWEIKSVSCSNMLMISLLCCLIFLTGYLYTNNKQPLCYVGVCGRDKTQNFGRLQTQFRPLPSHER
jgi:hypothetical protein